MRNSRIATDLAANTEDPPAEPDATTRVILSFSGTEVYVDLERWGEARTQLEAIAGLEPTMDVDDPLNKEEAADLLAEIRDR